MAQRRRVVTLEVRRRIQKTRRHPREHDEADSARERFVETAYWNPLVVTGKDGKARVTFKAPTALSEYRITARGVTGADTLAGQTTASLDGPQELLRRPQGPRLAHPGRQAAVHRPGPSYRCRRASSRSGSPSTPADATRSIPRRSSSSRTESTRSCSSRSRFPRRTRFG